MNIQCDKCKKIYDASFDTVISFNVEIVGRENDYHICPKCSEELQEFIYSYESKKIKKL